MTSEQADQLLAAVETLTSSVQWCWWLLLFILLSLFHLTPSTLMQRAGKQQGEGDQHDEGDQQSTQE